MSLRHMQRCNLLKTVYFLLLLSYWPDSNASNSITVLYPDVRAPYNQIFDQIIAGIHQENDGNLRTIALGKSANLPQTIQQLDNPNTEMIVGLGKRGYMVAKQLYKKKPVVVGALPIKPNGISGISLLASPGVLFDSLQELAPQIKRVAVLYTATNQWQIDLARMRAKQVGLELMEMEVNNIKQALAEYDQLLKKLDSKTDAIWLPLDPVTANERVILPKLLEDSWEKNFILFSSKPAHAKKGALFSLYPNHFELGKRLAKMLKRMYKEKQKIGVKPLSDMNLAVNLRTAAHLGLSYDNKQKDKFHLVFPE